MQLAGATVAYKTRLQETVAMSSTEAELWRQPMLAKSLFLSAASCWILTYHKRLPLSCMKTMKVQLVWATLKSLLIVLDIWMFLYFALAEWIERDLLCLARVDTKSNVADNFTKALSRILFHRHANVSLGHIPPSYSPLDRTRVGSNSQPPPTLHEVDTFPSCAAAAKVVAPTYPWGFVQTMTPLFT